MTLLLKLMDKTLSLNLGADAQIPRSVTIWTEIVPRRCVIISPTIFYRFKEGIEERETEIENEKERNLSYILNI